MGTYRLRSLDTGEEFDDNGWILEAPGAHRPALLRTVYRKRQIEPGPPELGMFRFADWLPIRRILPGSSAPLTYRSERLAARLGLSDLWVSFSGFWPERGCLMTTGTFKELEAYAVCARLDACEGRVLVVASSGNTARAFARVCSDHGIPLLLCVPEDRLASLWFDRPTTGRIHVLCPRSGSDYTDAIHLSHQVCALDGFLAEGGARNVARRDGLGTTVLSAVTTIGEIPNYYFQAVGSGTGAIAAWEANLRLLEDGRFGHRTMALMLSQNSPFTPIADAWEHGTRELLPIDERLARRQVQQTTAKELSNREPAYAVIGGLHDALAATGGTVLRVTNREAAEAADVFRETEGVDLDPAAAVATASLITAVREGRVRTAACVLLNLTGGGAQRLRSGKTLYRLEPSLIVDVNPPQAALRNALAGLRFT